MVTVGYSLVGGTALEVGELRLTADKPVSLYVRYRDGQPRELVMGYASRATVKVRWQGREQTIAAQPRQAYRLGPAERERRPRVHHPGVRPGGIRQWRHHS